MMEDKVYDYDSGIFGDVNWGLVAAEIPEGQEYREQPFICCSFRSDIRLKYGIDINLKREGNRITYMEYQYE